MILEWSAECAADDPILVVPWSDETGDLRFIDLRDDPYEVDLIPEAEQHPPLLHALRALNGPRSPVFTAKCDAWPLTDSDDAEELRNLRLTLDLEPELARAGFTSYIDLLWRDRTTFASFHQQEHLLHRLERRAGALEHPQALLEAVIRPALVDLAGPQEGFAISLYVKAVAEDEGAAREHWGAALEDIVALVRSKELTPNA